MNNKQQTAVEWLVEQFKEYDFADVKDTENYIIKMQSFVLTEKLDKAKEMEKAEKIKFATDFFFWWYNQTSGTNTYEAVEKFYEQTYGGGEQ